MKKLRQMMGMVVAGMLCLSLGFLGLTACGDRSTAPAGGDGQDSGTSADLSSGTANSDQIGSKEPNDNDPTTYSTSSICQKICKKVTECDEATDESDCRSECEKQVAVNNVPAAYLTCVTSNLTCPIIASDAALEQLLMETCKSYM